MTAIFPGAFLAIIIMGVALEFGKIASVTFLHQFWRRAPFLIKSYLFLAVFVLMLINTIGIFGQLSKAHIEAQIATTNQSSQTVVLHAKVDNEKTIIADLDKQISQIDSAIQKLTDTGRAASSLQQSTAQRKVRDGLVAQKTTHLTTLQDLTTQIVTADAVNRKAAADFGPLKYIADAVYGDASDAQLEIVVRWIIVLLVSVFDPLAIFLLIAAQFTWSQRRNHLTEKDMKNIITIDNDKILGH